MFLSSRRHDGSEETRGGREIKERELERKRAEKKTKQEEMRGDRQDGEGEKKPTREVVGGEACCVF